MGERAYEIRHKADRCRFFVRGLEEALLAMGFPADWFDGLGLDDRDAWRILGNSVHVPLLELFYESLLDVYAARHGDDVDAERRRAIAVVRGRAKAAFDF